MVGLDNTYPDLHSVIVQASSALARLDADRLEEMAHCCEALIGASELARSEEAASATAAAREMAAFAGVLEATTANLRVMRRLREAQSGRLEYRVAKAAGVALESTDGNG